MADFPAIEPTTRTYGLGRYSEADVAGIAGTTVRFVHRSAAIDRPLSLAFQELVLAEMDDIRQHFKDHGTHRAFRLPGVVWCGRTGEANTTAWKYAGQPSEAPGDGLFYTATVELVSTQETVARTTTDPS